MYDLFWSIRENEGIGGFHNNFCKRFDALEIVVFGNWFINVMTCVSSIWRSIVWEERMEGSVGISLRSANHRKCFGSGIVGWRDWILVSNWERVFLRLIFIRKEFWEGSSIRKRSVLIGKTYFLGGVVFCARGEGERERKCKRTLRRV